MADIDYGHWDTSLVGDFDPADYFGFVYLIEDIQTRKKYIGRKQLVSQTRRKQAGSKRKKVIRKDSDWRTYSGSSDFLNEDIEKLGKDRFKFTILHLCSKKGELGYMETYEQFSRDVLNARFPTGEREYYNANIMSRWFANDNPKTAEHREKLRQQNLGKPLSEETKAKMSAAKWYHNGTECRRFTTPPDETWIRGRLPIKKAN